MSSSNRLKYRAYFRALLIICLLVLSKPLICQNTNNLILHCPMHGKVTTSQLCLKAFNVNIRLGNCRDDIVIPNVFTPNGDGLNDFWVISNINKYPEASIEVFNRWGTVVFRSTESRKIWDGMFNGRKVTPGTYCYSVILNNGLEAFKGPLLIFW